MYSWGEVKLEEFGFSPLRAEEKKEEEDEKKTTTLLQANLFSPVCRKDKLQQILCKHDHLFCLLSNGDKAVSFQKDRSSNSHSQPPANWKFRFVKLNNEKILSVDCGTSHVLLLSKSGSVLEYSFSEQKLKSNVITPRVLGSLSKKNIIQVACGNHHSLALSKEGQVFTWGQSTESLPKPGIKDSLQPTPQPVKHLEGIPLAQIAAGGAHSIVVSVSGAVYSWGKNDAGQLGLGHTNEVHCPTFIKALEQKKTVFVSCGEKHTVVLMKDGLVFTFGAGGYGQLGHNSTRNEVKPRLVAELLGAKVSQVACGRFHTIAFAAPPGKVYAFGCGEHGQLGNMRTCNQLIPLPVELQTDAGITAGVNHGSSTLIASNKVIAGGNQTIVFHCQEECSAEAADQFLHWADRYICSVEDELVENWLTTDSKQWKKIEKEINLVFSSAANVNGCFLEQSKDDHFKASTQKSALNLSAARLFFKKIARVPRVFNQVKAALQKLLTSFLDPAASVEAFRVFLIVPELLRVLKKKEEINELTRVLSEAILRLQKDKLQILDQGQKFRTVEAEPDWPVQKPGIFQALVETNKYFQFGVLCGLMVYNHCLAYLPFPLALFKKLLDEKPSLEDFKELDNRYGKSLQYIHDYECNDLEEVLGYNFSAFWQNQEVELVPNGKDIPLTTTNKQKFIETFLNYVFNESVERLFDEFRRGLYKVCDREILEFFKPQELMAVMVGNADYDWQRLQQNTLYGGGYSPSHPTITMFWKVFHELPLDQKKAFLLFVTGSDRIPPCGMDGVRITIARSFGSNFHMPEAYTCYNMIQLPMYTTVEHLKERLLKAISYNSGFGIG
ncbi:E3 ISG15--protein ligase HERC5 [Latimeria chalumnae]|uniref:E3 ISG15--protein ligase HERC5 n=1 Tax=Latimeria chalumnae TaxID=7897 RepID=UPI00313EA596